MDSQPAEPIELTDAVVLDYFAHVHWLGEETARLLRERKPVPKRNPPVVNPLDLWLMEMLLPHALGDGPERAWPVIRELIARAPDMETLGYLGSGSLEDLVRTAGPQFAERIEAASNADPRLALALGFVWPDEAVSDELRTLIMRARQRSHDQVTFPNT